MTAVVYCQSCGKKLELHCCSSCGGAITVEKPKPALEEAAAINRRVLTSYRGYSHGGDDWK